MSHERVIGDARSRALHPEEPREPEPSQGTQLTPELVSHLQRGAGNAAVGRLLRETTEDAAGPALRTAAQFKSDSKLKSGLVTLPRSDALKRVDDALAAYDLVRGGDLGACQQALWDLALRITDWKKSKATTADPKAWEDAKRADEIDALAAEQVAELARVQQAMNDAQAVRDAAAAANKRVRMDALLTSAIKSITDPSAKARAVFAAYMGEFRGKASYRTTTPVGVTIWEASGVVACSMISNGLVDLLRHAGLTAKRIQIAPEDFVTKRLGTDFIDPAAEGNVRRPRKTFMDERRYFFNKHWIVEVADGALYLDPTSGIEVSADAAEIIDYADMARVVSAPPVYANGTWRVSHVGNNNRGDGAYELTPDEEDSSASETS